jgi:hypothetical protein
MLAKMGELPDKSTERFEHFATERLPTSIAVELTALAEARLDLPPDVSAAAAALARTAPPPHALRALRRSALVAAEPLPERAREHDGG